MSEILMPMLISAAAASTNEIVLVAPFMKYDIIKEILSNTASGLEVRLVTRWIPIEIISGVSDIEVYDLVRSRNNTKLFVHPLLHAKLYRFDDVMFMGSANLTRKALGWASPSNIELLFEVPDLAEDLKKFESSLFSKSILVDINYYDVIKKQVDELRANPPITLPYPEVEGPNNPHLWLPLSRDPHRLWQIYSEGSAARRFMTESAFEAANADLSVLNVEPNLNFNQFTSNLSAILDQMPLVHEINSKAIYGISTHEATLLIDEAKKAQQLPYNSNDMWEILQAWLIYFFPNRYRREASNEILRMGREI